MRDQNSALKKHLPRLAGAAPLVVALISALAGCDPGAQPLGNCNAQTCATGCCDINDNCVMPTHTNACGIGGAQCIQCSAGDVCNEATGQCVDENLGGARGGVCNVQNCAGCCDPVTNQCRLVPPGGGNHDACGVGGQACQNCRTQGLFCAGGTCRPDQCDSTTCPTGCCMNGVCQQGGNLDQACGAGGNTCNVCAFGERCVNQTCQSSTCGPANCPTGCCDNNDNCMPGTQESACGKNGLNCMQCGNGQACSMDKVCASQASTCNPGTCQGCCSASGCQTGNSSQACGVNGGFCQQCGAGMACVNGRCTCSPQNCNGCCDGDICRPGNEYFACGRNGMQCQPCGNGQCTGGQCAFGGGYSSGPQYGYWGCWAGSVIAPGIEDVACGRFGEQCDHCAMRGAYCTFDQRCSDLYGDPFGGWGTPPFAVWDVFVTYVEVDVPPAGYEYDSGWESGDGGPPPELYIQSAIGPFHYGRNSMPHPESYRAYFNTLPENRMAARVTTDELLSGGITYSVYDADSWNFDDMIAGPCSVMVTDMDLYNNNLWVWGCPGQPQHRLVKTVAFNFRLTQ